MNKKTMRALIAAPALALAASGFVATYAAEPASSAAPAYGPGYEMGPGMMGGYGPGTGYHRSGPGAYGPGSPGRGFGYGAPWMMGGGYGGYGMGPGMMGGGGYGGYGMGPWMMDGGYGGYGMGPWIMGGRYGMGPGMWGFGAGSALALTEAQQQKIAAIEDAQFKKQWALIPQMRSAMVGSRRNFETGKIDVDAAMKSAKAMEDLRLQMLRNHLETIKQIDAVLTPEQRAKLQRARSWGLQQ